MIYFKRLRTSAGAGTAADGDIALAAASDIKVLVYLSTTKTQTDFASLTKVFDKTIKFVNTGGQGATDAVGDVAALASPFGFMKLDENLSV